MKRGIAALLAALLLISGAAMGEGANDEAWQMLLAALASDEPHPVPAERLLTVDHLSVSGGLDKSVMNVLLLGTDAEAGDPCGRADVLMICSVNTESGKIRLAALPEMTLVPVEGLPTPIRLKYVNCFGGPLLTIKTVNELLGLNIERYCAVNFQSFVSVIDRVGGVRIELTENERLAVGCSAEDAAISGEQALRYAKLRQGEAVTDRPRKLLEALLPQLAPTSIGDAFSLAETLLAMLDTNLTTDNLMDLIFAVIGRDVAGMMETAALPEELSAQEMRKILHRWLYETDNAA